MHTKSKIKKKSIVSNAPRTTLGDLLGKELTQVKLKAEKNIKDMVRKAMNDPEVQKSSKKFSSTAKAKVAVKK